MNQFRYSVKIKTLKLKLINNNFFKKKLFYLIVRLIN